MAGKDLADALEPVGLQVQDRVPADGTELLRYYGKPPEKFRDMIAQKGGEGLYKIVKAAPTGPLFGNRLLLM